MDWRTGIYDQYLFDLRKTVVDNFENGNYQVAYFYAHLIFMSFVYYCIEKAYQFQPNRMKDILYPLNAYRGKDCKKPSLENYKSVYDFSLFPEKDIFKVFYVIGMDDALIKNFATYINSRDDFAHATGQGNISIDSLRQNIRTISGNMESLFQVFQPHMKTIYVKYLIEHSNHLYRTIIDTIDDFISDNQFSLKDIDFLCHLGMRVVQDEKQLSHEQYLMIRKVHCAFGADVKTAREKLGISRRELAEKIGVDPRYLANIELNATIPSMPLVVQLFHLCRLPAEKYFNPELRKQETEQYQRVKYKVQLCPEKYLPAIESAIDELMKLDK